VLIIGGGIVGLCCAVQFRLRQIPVVIVERGEPGVGCSWGNAGLLAPGSCVPMGMPGIARQLPKWLLTSSGSVRISSVYAMRNLHACLALLRAASPSQALSSARAIRAITSDVFKDLEPITSYAGAGDLVHRRGYLYIYPSSDAFEAAHAMWSLREACGVRREILSGPPLRKLQAGLGHAEVGVYLPDEGYCFDPYELSKRIATKLARDGTEFVSGVAGKVTSKNAAVQIAVGDRQIEASHLVIAAGLSSVEILAGLGVRMPMLSVRGYSFVCRNAGVALNIPVMSGTGRFAATPMSFGTRIAGGADVDFAGAKPCRTMMEKIKRSAMDLLPDLYVDTNSCWVGARSLLPDSVPVIGALREAPNIVIATGHGFAGLTCAPTTSKIVASLVMGEPTGLDLSRYHPQRYHHSVFATEADHAPVH
jgi:glycine/D-amino acid oxidase-like deaminating enzyme